ncbi:glycerol-3-phosphate dehydrogenase/oxidase [Telluria mixta]|uniref:Glycerol-3-phosphate dehydrogenase/oxidase n=1 Tax=Telluria mixta TaxID=34071 RepID=A0ABT2BTA7_9BURK|nr:glycerol-3-phosphate dehydrogenase/oxidase [Telluria mixta]MCS0628355.1 glycerol-3-phosphate dehydrogenase/oxidase [Telluria mixta]WEM93537.1 glycerol-3-phosphate dehydrogenase/oxidase [Telluria mixta]
MSGAFSALWRQGGRAGLGDVLARDWDVLVIGGGISGAGVLLEAARRGLKALLVERRDFAWGTSSRSSKLVHGGLRYLKDGHVRLTAESVREREMLLACAPGLVEPQGFAFAQYDGARGRRSFLAGLAIYDVMAGRRERHWLDADDFLMAAPNVKRDGLAGGIVYTDARTDDARLVLRVLREALDHGAAAVNYLGARELLRSGDRVCGALLAGDGTDYEVRARVVVDATGAWSGPLHGGGPRLRPLRGSHLVLPAWRLPLARAVSLMHPHDGRPVFAFPWEGATLVGTTDLDHAESMDRAARITRAEVDYLMMALQAQFPSLQLTDRDIVSTYAGVRPVIAGKEGGAPSQEGREHVAWSSAGLVAIAGGKLTTFRAIALDALRLVKEQLPGWDDPLDACAVFAPVPQVGAGAPRRLHGRYGACAAALLDAALPGELARIPGTETAWAELRWAARCEAVHHLDDLLLRRTRLGLLLRDGGTAHMERIRAICQPELGWDDARWAREDAAYREHWTTHHGLPHED